MHCHISNPTQKIDLDIINSIWNTIKHGTDLQTTVKLDVSGVIVNGNLRSGETEEIVDDV